MLPLLAALWLGSAAAAPDPSPIDPPSPSVGPATSDPCRSPPADPTAPFAVELERAKTLYRRGCHVWALDLLQALDGRRRVESVDPVASVTSRLFLGEVLFVLGRRDEARALFEALLAEFPDTRMSLLEHDPEVIDLFEVVRRARASAVPPVGPPPVVIPPRPRVYLLPFGSARLFVDEPPKLSGNAIAQGVCGAASLGSYLLHRQWIGTAYRIPEEDIPISVALKALNYGSTACLIGLYVGWQVRAKRDWRARPHPQITLTPEGVRATF